MSARGLVENEEEIAIEDNEPSKYKRNQQHSKVVIVLVAILAFTYCLSLLFPNAHKYGWTPTSIGNASDSHPTDLTPADFAFSIWALIFVWQFGWIFYVVINLCRRTFNGPLYLNPPIVTPTFALSYIVSLIAIISWYFAWTNGVMWASFILLAIITIAVWLCIAILTRGLHEHEYDFTSNIDLWIFRLFVLNGLAIFATWTTLATHINVACVCIYDFGASIETGSTVALVMLLFEVTAYFFLDVFRWDRFLRFNFISYLVVIWAMSSIIIRRKEMDGGSPDVNYLLSALLLTVACVTFPLKIVIVVIRTRRRNSHEVL